MKNQKSLLVRFAESLGFQINEEAIQELNANEYDMAYPDNWDEMSEEEQMAWKEKHKKEMPKANQDEPEEPKQNTVKLPENLVKLNALIEEMGGIDAYKGLLLGAVEAVESMQQNQEVERANLVATLVNNSAITEDELKDVETSTLKLMVKTIPTRNVDYSMLGAGSMQHNKDEVAEMPDIFALVTKED